MPRCAEPVRAEILKFYINFEFKSSKMQEFESQDDCFILSPKPLRGLSIKSGCDIFF
jgi:hypothetical protein